MQPGDDVVGMNTQVRVNTFLLEMFALRTCLDAPL